MIRDGKDAARASYAILDDPDQDPEDSERRGELSPGGEYVFRDGKLMAALTGDGLIGKRKNSDRVLRI